MSLALWTIVAFMLGLVIYLAAPILLGPSLPDRLRRGLARTYMSQATASARRTTLVDRINSGHTLIATDFDAEWGVEVSSVGDEEYRIEDPQNRMTRLFGRPFGMISERFDVMCSIRDAALGELHEVQEERGDHIVPIETGDDVVEAGNAHLDVSGDTELVSLHGIAGLLGGRASPTLAEEAYDDIKKSQAAFNSRSVLEVMSFILAFAAVYALMWFAASQGGGGGGSSVSMPIPFMGVPLW